jgi:hypothetical protein
VLSFAAEKDLGVLINRPLNAVAGGRLLRLADLAQTEGMDTNEVIETIRQLAKSESRLWRTILPRLDIPEGLRTRVRQQNEIADSLKHYWKNFGSYEGFRQAKDGVFWPRVQGVLDFLEPHGQNDAELGEWLTSHRRRLGQAFEAVGSIYVEEAARVLNRIRYAVDEADPEWKTADTLSQKAIRALRSTAGVSTVLVGMRNVDYVEDVLAELRRPAVQAERRTSWENLRHALAAKGFVHD